ncbi:hypothetical protein SASPL_147675 [Salvia splendens]|uniref:anthocyanidin 3-O-glucoside 5-O-glucosyltransferase n=1 Tax=Salvia splendens TaxID=180675 RepID=A0A8X8Z6X6_SALSN|nr:hypothetical protein SASPL_147675 [Salvia splendens]
MADAKGLTFLGFDDGYDDGFKLSGDTKKFMTSIRSNGSKALRDAIAAAAEEGHPVTCLVYSLILPWATEVAQNPNPRSSAALQNRSSLLPSSSELDNSAIAASKEQFDLLDAEPGKPKVLVNTFDSLEAEALSALDCYELISIGPLIPSAFIGGEDPSENSFGSDLFEKSDCCIEWLNSKPQSSVVYVSFGSLLRLPKAQKEEIAGGLLRSRRPFLWVMRDSEEEEEKLSCSEDLDKIGKIVTWCSQLEVLTHQSLGCFVTHCGWNSTLGSLSCGVPVVGFPGLADQGTNAKMIEDVWRIGVRVRGNEDGIVESREIWRCVEEVMDGGLKSLEYRQNANKWKGLAGEAVAENGNWGVARKMRK